MGMSYSAHASAMPSDRTWSENNETSTSTAQILCILAARRIVLALTSLNEIPPIFPSFTKSDRACTVVSIGTLRSTREHSNRSIFFLPSRTLRQVSTLRRTPSGVPSGVKSGFKQPLMLRTILLASLGNRAK